LSASEIIIAAGSAGVGVAVGSVAVYLYSRNNSIQKSEVVETTPAVTEPKDVQPVPSESSSTLLANSNQSRSIPKSALEKSKQELRTLTLEKELVSAALTRLYEAEAAKEITKAEREILGAKYVSELKSLDDKITKMDAFIQVGDLETLRNQLLQLVEQKIDAIERRIESTRKLAEPLIAEMTQKQPPPVVIQPQSVDETQRGTPVPDISDMLQNEKPEPRIDPIAEQQSVAPTIPKAQSTVSALERKRPADKVEELQKELLEALDRLERLDVDSP
jgi:hypothetical protein